MLNQLVRRQDQRKLAPPHTGGTHPVDEGARRLDAGQPSRVAVAIATRGRAQILSETIAAIDRQVRRPDVIVISCVTEADAATLPRRPDIVVLTGASGLPRQRNAALSRIGDDADIVIFFDDDFIAHPHWIDEVERAFRTRAEVDAITGNVVADGIKGPGLAVSDACAVLDSVDIATNNWALEDCSPYGCNMAFRSLAIRDLRFDERLVLYGWLEDRDFGGALARRGGKLIKLGSALGVHLGVKAARIPGRRLGYSQVVNPVYLHRKGTMTFISLAEHLLKNIGSNVARCLVPEHYVDRPGRLRGNLIGIGELLSGAARPERAEML